MSSFGSGSTRPFDDDGYTGYDPRLESKRFNSFSNFDADSVNDSSPIFSDQPYLAGDDAFSSHPVPRTQSLPSMYSKGGPSLQSPAEMEPDEGFPLKEWRRRNVLELEEKEKKEKEKLQRIIEEAEAYKVEFYRKRQLSVEKKKASNRESEKVFVENQEKFQAEAEKNYWKAIAELIPREVAAIEKREKKRDKDREKKASVVVVQGSKPGKPTDLSRMRQILVKLNYNPPQHMKPKPEPTAQPKQDAKAIVVINEAAVAAA
ncbi:unnamed protein product [Prunus brigantina]